MGHQLSFLMLPADLPIVEAAIRSTGDVCFLESRRPAADQTEIGTLAFQPGEMGHRPLGAYIVRGTQLGEVKNRFVDAEGYWVIDSLSSPVIEFSRCFFDGHLLRRGRAYFATDSRFRFELPGDDFVAWGDRVLRRIKDTLQRVPEISTSAYVSSDARRWIEEHHATADYLDTFRATDGT
jgi:hypothetical protein